MRAALLALYLVATSCVWESRPEPVVPDPVEPAPPAPSDDVVATCDQWRRLGCEEGQTTARGTTCEEVLRDAEGEGADLTPPLDCARAARDCDAIRECESR